MHLRVRYKCPAEFHALCLRLVSTSSLALCRAPRLPFDLSGTADTAACPRYGVARCSNQTWSKWHLACVQLHGPTNGRLQNQRAFVRRRARVAQRLLHDRTRSRCHSRHRA